MLATTGALAASKELSGQGLHCLPTGLQVIY